MDRYRTDVLADEVIYDLARKWWGEGIIPRHYLEALREAAKLGAENAAHLPGTDEAHAGSR